MLKSAWLWLWKMCKNPERLKTERNLSLTCQHEDKKKESGSPSPPLSSCTCLFLKDIQSRAETVKALSVSLSCNGVTGWALRTGRWAFDVRVQKPGPWSRLLHSQVLPPLTASPPPPPPLCLEDGGHFTLTKTEVWGSGWGWWGDTWSAVWLQRNHGNFLDSLDIDVVERVLSYQIFEVPITWKAELWA